ncbi:dentin sialophosphoprotein-like [Mytilus edulis]|uniref:dentin sialophosphoprotein-like n=1 Tax=Mytilus edulis TaxID=6550 RepID=UPI0039F0EC8F
MYGLMGLISLVIVLIIIIVGIKTSNHVSSNKRKKEDVKEHAVVVNKRSYSVQITELQSPLEDIIEDSETSNEQLSDGRNSGNGRVLEVQTSFKNDKLNKRLTTFKRGSHQSKPELGNITTGKADETSDYDDSINNICHTKTQTEQSVLNSNTKNIESHHMEHIPCINSRSEHEDNYHPTKDFKEQYQPNKPTITIHQDSKTETENKICPELALQVDFDDIKDSEEFSNPASLITNQLSGDNNDIEDSQDVSNSSRRQIDYTDELTGDYDDIEDLEDASHATRRQNQFTDEVAGDYDDIKDSKDVTDSSRGPLVFTNDFTGGDYDDITDSKDVTDSSRGPLVFTNDFTGGDYDDITDSKDVTDSSRGPLVFTNDFTGGDYDDIDTSEEMSAPFQCTHVFTSERIPDYDEIDERIDAVTPNEEKHIFTKKLSLKGIYDGIDETTHEMIPANNLSKFTFTEENDSKSSISQFDDYDEIEDSSDTMYTTTDPYIGMSHGSSATKEQYMDMSQGIRATQLSNSDGSSTTNTNSNHSPLGKRTNEPIYAISSKKSMKIKSKESSLVPETLLKSENIATTNIYSNSSSPSITNEPIYAISTKKSMKIKSKEDNLVPETISNIQNMTTTNSKSHNPSSSISNEPIYAISTKSSMKIKSKEPDLVTEPIYAISSKTSSEM